MKKSIVLIGILLCVICSAGRCFAENDNPLPTLLNIDCEHWITFEDDRIDWYRLYFAKEGTIMSKAFETNQRLSERDNKTAYIMGLIDAFANMAIIQNNDSLYLKFRVGQYRTEIDEYCELQENKDTRVALALLNVNKILRDK